MLREREVIVHAVCHAVCAGVTFSQVPIVSLRFDSRAKLLLTFPDVRATPLMAFAETLVPSVAYASLVYAKERMAATDQSAAHSA